MNEVPIEEPAPLRAHRRAIEALLSDKAGFAVFSPDAPDWRLSAVELQQPDRVWSLLPIPQPEALEAVRLIAPNEQLKTVLTVVLSVGELPSATVLADLEAQLGVEVIACSPDAARGGPLAAGEGGSLARFEAALARERDPRLDVDEAYAEGKSVGEQLVFEHDLIQQAPIPYLTRAIVIACVAIWVLQVLTGISASQPSVHALRAWGASAPDLTLAQPWRLVSAGFLHGGLVHLALNMWILWTFGPFCERLFGRVGYVVIYLTAITGGFLASVAFNPPIMSAVGASGGILGLVGAVLGFALLRRDVIPKPVAVRLAKGIGTFLALNGVLWIAIGAMFPIDHAGHGGGFLIGFLGGVGLARPIPPPEREEPRRVLAALGLLILIAIGWTQVRAHPHVLQKAGVLRLVELEPQFAQFDAICSEVVELNRSQIQGAARQEKAAALRQRVATLREQRLGSPDPLPQLEEVRLRFDEALAALDLYLEREVDEDPAVIVAATEFVEARGRLLDQLKLVRKE